MGLIQTIDELVLRVLVSSLVTFRLGFDLDKVVDLVTLDLYLNSNLNLNHT
jgi:hypothetical protein